MSPFPSPHTFADDNEIVWCFAKCRGDAEYFVFIAHMVGLRQGASVPVQNLFEVGLCKEHFTSQSEVLLTADEKKTILRSIPKCSLQQAKK